MQFNYIFDDLWWKLSHVVSTSVMTDSHLAWKRLKNPCRFEENRWKFGSSHVLTVCRVIFYFQKNSNESQINPKMTMNWFMKWLLRNPTPLLWNFVIKSFIWLAFDPAKPTISWIERGKNGAKMIFITFWWNQLMFFCNIICKWYTLY